MSLTARTLKSQLSKGVISPCYFIMGPELFLIQEILKQLTKSVLSSESRDLNYEVFRAGEDKIIKMRTAIETLPVFSDKRLIVCRVAEKLSPADWNLLKPVLKSPVGSSVLVFISENPDKRKKVIKELMSFCEVVSAESPKESQWPQWLKWMGEKEGLSFSTEAMALMKERAFYDLMNLETEVKKLKQFLGSGKQVSKEDVLNIIPRVRAENVFALSKAIGQKNLSLALACLAKLLEDNHSEIGALALISRHIRILLRVKEGLKNGHTEKTICRKADVPAFFIHEYIQSAHLWTESKINSTLATLKVVDKALKSSPVPSYIWLENFIIKTCSAS